MNVRELDQFYRFLKLCWKQEITFKDKIQEIENPDQLIPKTKELLSYIAEQKAHLNTEVFKELLQTYYDRILFMINDFLAIRATKILEKTKNGEFVDEDFLLELELPFYNNLVTGFKGYRKTIRFALNHAKEKASDKISIEVPKDPRHKKQTKTAEPDTHVLDEDLIDEEEYEDYLADMLSNEGEVLVEEVPTPQAEMRAQVHKEQENTITQTEPPREKAITQEISSDQIARPTNYNREVEMTAVRFLTNVKSLVGQDFRVYGPFKQGDVVYLPKTNAEILENDEAVKPIKIIR